MTQNQENVQTPDEAAFIKVAGAMETSKLTQRFSDMLKVAEGTEEERFAALSAFAINVLARDKSATWESIGAVGQAAMRATIDSIADEQGVSLETQKADWLKIKNRNAPAEEPAGGGE